MPRMPANLVKMLASYLGHSLSKVTLCLKIHFKKGVSLFFFFTPSSLITETLCSLEVSEMHQHILPCQVKFFSMHA